MCAVLSRTGPKEGIGALAWHPLRSILASTAPNTGRIYLWARSYAEKWSAFAPDFKVCLAVVKQILSTWVDKPAALICSCLAR